MTRRRILAILLSGLACLLYWPSGVLAASSELVMISEVQLQGLSAKDEFVEIYNDGVENFDLTNCQLKKFTASGTGYLLHRFVAGATIMAQDFYVVGSSDWIGEADERYSTSQSLADDNSLQLICGETILDLVAWGKASLFEGQVLSGVVNSELWSYQRSTKLDTDNNFLDFTVGLPSANSACLVVDANEVAENIVNENSEQTEPIEVSGGEAESVEVLDGDELVISDEVIVENLSDINQNENVVGDFTENLVENPTENIIEEISVELAPVLASVSEELVVVEEVPAENVVSSNVESENSHPTDSRLIFLSELYPAPNSGENEYLEIYNSGDVKIDLSDWFITDLSEKKYVLKDLVLEPGEYFLIYYAQSKITLNNDEDQINLYNSLGQWRHGVRYVKAQKGKALFLDDSGQWRWGEGSPGFVNPEFVEVPTNVSLETIKNDDNIEVSTNPILVVADPAPVLEGVSGEIKNSENANSNISITTGKPKTTGTVNKKIKEYQISNLAAWSTWQANDLVLVTAKVLADSSWGVTNRCFLGQGNYAVPILCTTLKEKFKIGQNVLVKAKVYFKDAKFEYLKIEEVLPYLDDVDLAFRNDQGELEEYQLWQGRGIIDELNSSRRSGKLANTTDVWSFRFPKGNEFVIGDQVFWQAVHWKGENYFFLTESSGKIESDSLSESAESTPALEPAMASAPGGVDGKLFGAAFSGFGGSCYAVWRWRGVFLKFFPKIFA